MKVRNKKTKAVGESSRFNVNGLGEIVVAYENGEYGSVYIKDHEVFIRDKWIDMATAFQIHLLITDNYNTSFFEPKSEEDKIRGYTL